jgi:ribonucleotide monophosphatase NagD (HAD superfamily)
MKKIRVPAVISDIDGVIYRGKTTIGSSPQAMRMIMGYHMRYGQRVLLPFALLTNGGGILEKARAKVINRIVFGSEGTIDRKLFIQGD